MRIALDAMGGDFAPQVLVEGAYIAKDSPDVELVLVGDEVKIREIIGDRNIPFEIVHTDEAIGMDEHPTQAIKTKKRASLVVAVEMLKAGKVDAVVSAGNTGAFVACASLILGTLPGIERPSIGVTIPTLKNPVFIIDTGANVDCKPNYLYQFAIMGISYSHNILGIENPRVGLLNIGAEETKGNNLTKSVYPLLKKLKNFVGNIEGNDIFENKADVIVCDGFVGNVLLKFAEGFAYTFGKMVKDSIIDSSIPRSARFFVDSAINNAFSIYDFSEYGGTPLLGVNGVCIVAHGRSNAKAIFNSIKVAKRSIESNLLKEIEEGVTSYVS
ncbi:MAG: phosphate acyltransferase PlsX [bacterium]|nr:phosphate acyltransferase PlsX [bacterium]